MGVEGETKIPRKLADLHTRDFCRCLTLGEGRCGSLILVGGGEFFEGFGVDFPGSGIVGSHLQKIHHLPVVFVGRLHIGIVFIIKTGVESLGVYLYHHIVAPRFGSVKILLKECFYFFFYRSRLISFEGLYCL